MSPSWEHCTDPRHKAIPHDADREGRRRVMGAVIERFARGAIRPAIGARFALAEVRQAHALLDAGTALGKIVMHP